MAKDQNKKEETKLVLSGINRDFEEKNTLKSAEEQKLSYVNIGKTPINPDYLKLIPYETSKKAKILAFYKVGDKVRVAVVDQNDPATAKALEDLRAQGFKLNLNLASPSGLIEALEKYQQIEVYKKKEIIEDVDVQSIKTYEKEIAELKELEQKIPEVTAEEAINLINVGAMKTNASDVHYEPEVKHVQVRLRIDGVLHPVFTIRHKEYKNILNQVKFQTKMKLNVADVPQDGRYDFNYNDRVVDVRVSVLPTEETESIVCRFLDSGKKFTSIEDLGFEGENLARMKKLLTLTHGMILVTGPTGSGKTTTLYSLLQGFNTPEKKIITLENPIEYHLDGVIQSQINEKEDYTFARGLKAILRQDPDIVMIGEIRDLDTANTAAQAALTGHVLLATLHTNSAAESIPRLMNMGMEPFMTAPAIDTLIAQRLVRKVCKKCSQKTPFTEQHKQEFDKAFSELQKTTPTKVPAYPKEIATAKGCDACSQTGYLGRMVIAEIIQVDDEIKELILKKASTGKILELARKKGFVTMEEDGFTKIAEGHTTIEEIHRVINLGSS
jgi:type IV pilus assembly protein PilB